MKTYIDKDALVAKIESMKKFAQILSDEAIISNKRQFYDGKEQGYDDILSFLDTLEVEEVNSEELEQEVVRVWKTLNDDFVYQLHWEDFREAAIHFVNWQRERMKKEAVKLGKTIICWEGDNEKAFPNKIKSLIIKAED